MKYLVTFFWTFVLGQVVGYLGSSLTSGTYDFTLTTIISLVAAVIFLIIAQVAQPKKTNAKAN